MEANHERQSQPEQQFLDVLRTRLTNIPELRSALAYIELRPEESFDIFDSYLSLVHRMVTLSETELGEVQQASERLSSKSNNSDSTPQVSAIDLLSSLSHKPVLDEIAKRTTDTASPYMDRAISELTDRMSNAHQLKLSGRRLKDGDDESDRVIWSQTQIYGSLALVHVMFGHYLERYFALELSAAGIDVAEQKDFLINALTDVLIIDHLGDKQFSQIYDIWTTPKEKGGLGWIAPSHLDSYQTVS